jgi:DNA-binding FadR family transcriptional regulator
MTIMGSAIAGEETGVDADVRFHRTLADAAHNPLFSDFFEFINPHIRREVRLARQNTARLSHRMAAGLWLKVQDEHAAVFRAVEAGSSAKAAAAVRNHLRNTAKRLKDAPESAS